MPQGHLGAPAPSPPLAAAAAAARARRPGGTALPRAAARRQGDGVHAREQDGRRARAVLRPPRAPLAATGNALGRGDPRAPAAPHAADPRDWQHRAFARVGRGERDRLAARAARRERVEPPRRLRHAARRAPARLKRLGRRRRARAAPRARGGHVRVARRHRRDGGPVRPQPAGVAGGAHLAHLLQPVLPPAPPPQPAPRARGRGVGRGLCSAARQPARQAPSARQGGGSWRCRQHGLRVGARRQRGRSLGPGAAHAAAADYRRAARARLLSQGTRRRGEARLHARARAAHRRAGAAAGGGAMRALAARGAERHQALPGDHARTDAPRARGGAAG
eukprot:7389239-Prymnesium_polylepis.1